MILLKMFVYQPTLSTPELETEKGTDNIGWKLKGAYNSELVTLHGVFLSNINYLTRKIGMQFNNTRLVVEQNNYPPKIVNVYIVYDLNNKPKILLRNLAVKKCSVRLL